MKTFSYTLIRRLVLGLLMLTAMVGALHAQSSSTDPTFTPTFYTYGQVPEMMWNPLSEWLYCRVVAERMDGQDLDTNLIRLNADGDWDDTWALDHDGDITCLALLDDGKMLIGGDFTIVDDHATYRVARLNVDGSVDTTFATTSADLPAPDGEAFIDALAADDSGNVFVGLYSDNVEYSGTVFYCVGPLSTVMVPTFAEVNDVEHDSFGVRAFHVDDDALIIGGSFGLVNGVTRQCLVRLDFTGSVDLNFDISLYRAESFAQFDPLFCVNDIVEAADGNLWVGGCFTYDGLPGIMRITPSGDVLTPASLSFPNSARYPVGLIRDLSADGNDVLAVGFVLSPPHSRRGIQYRFSVDGQLTADLSVGDWSGSIEQVNGKIAVGKTLPYMMTIGSRSDQIPIVLADSLGDIIQDAPRHYLFMGVIPDTIAIRPGNRPVYYREDLFGVNDVYHGGLYALNADGTTDESFQIDFIINYLLDMKALPDGRLLLIGRFEHLSWAAEQGIVLLEPDGSLSPYFNEVISERLSLYTSGSIVDLHSGQLLLNLKEVLEINEIEVREVVFDYTDLEGKKLISETLVIEGIDSAEYHNQDRSISHDVTTIVQNALIGGGVTLEVSDSIMGVSTPSATLFLDVHYRTNYGNRRLRIREGKILVLPNPVWDSGLISNYAWDSEVNLSGKVAAQSDGSLVFMSEGDLARMLPGGALDESFQSVAEQFYDFRPISTLIDQPLIDGYDRIYLNGYFEKNEGDGLVELIRLMPDGTHDLAYNCSASFLVKRGAALDSEGNFYFSGNVAYEGVEKNFLVRIFNDGSFDENVFDISHQSLYVDYSPPNFLYANDKRYLLTDPIPPEVFITPTTAQLNEGDDVTFWLADRGAEETYQWMSHGVALAGQTGPSLRLDPATLANAGEIRVQATGPGGTVVRKATLNVTGFDFGDWGASVGLAPGELADPDVDPDGNGLSMMDEFLLRTDLDGPTSRSWATPVVAGGAMKLRWRMLPGRRYWVDCSTNLIQWDPVGSYTSASNEVFELPVDYDPETPCFYRVRVELAGE